MGSKRKIADFRICILFILLVAFTLRIWALDTVPPGLTHDETAHLQDAQRIWEGYRPIYLTSAYGREPLYDYAMAPLVGLMGMHVITGRLASALWGTVLVGLLYAWVTRAFDRSTATLATALMALSFWPLSTSRQILRSITMPTLFTAAMWLFWRAIYPATGHHQRRHFVLTGAILGLSFYTYMPSRIVWLVPTLFGLSLVLTDRPRWQRTRTGLGWMLLTMALVAAPLLVHLATHPDLEVRVDELAAPLYALRDGDPGPLWARVQETLLLFSHRGDVHWMYNFSSRPLLPPALAALFYIGVALVVYGMLRRSTSLPANWRQSSYRLLFLWLLLGVAPALVTGLESSSLRAIAAQPAVFTIAALPPVLLGRRFWPRLNRWARVGGIGLTLVTLALLGMRTVHDYFNVWANHRDTRVAYNIHLVEIARYLDMQSSDTLVGISTLYPGPLHSPYLVDVALNRTDLEMRWYDARFALVFPAVESHPIGRPILDADAKFADGQARAVFPALTPLDDALKPWFEPSARLLDRVELEPDDLVPWFEVYTWQPDAARATLPLTTPIDLGHVVAFVGHQLETTTVTPGGTVELLTFWRVLDVHPALADEELVIFTHVLGADGQIVGQQDRLDVPVWNWSPGDLFVQLHRFSIDADLSPGFYPLEIGLYARVEGFPRLPVYDPGNPAVITDRILLPPLEVVAP